MSKGEHALLEAIERETGAAPEWSVLWLHGLGADGSDFVPILPELVRRDWPAMRFVFPHAPVRAVTINNGTRMRAWYDIRDFDLANRADAAGVAESVVQVDALIEREVARGIPPARIFLAGFSQGGAVTLAAGLRRAVPLAGLVGLSTYLPSMHEAAGALASAATSQPLFMGHGSQDPVVPFAAGEQSAAWMRGHGFEVEFHRYPIPHSVCLEEIRDLGDWMSRRIAAA
ncbi:alpha/beta hydrolase [Luteimonas kalidii]|uniref:Carboxylesterase n=1 Tax=Luteimonas kalidii TaxID=3042025 RepID=A0ABT6JWJ6_9GAMM|nr:carboxylesterase [Luteimonas kalidii]MDH5834321.1 carboxylesterase [Luteimonas kalidii]